MVRACGVLNCTSTGIMPSHTFPINTHIREKWIKSLILKPYKEKEINKLRVCYKHFKESDYTGSPKLRRLIRTAIPFMTTDTCATQINNITKSQEQNVLQHQETITNLQWNVAQMQLDIENLSEQQEKQREIIAQMQLDIENLSEQKKQHEITAQMQLERFSQQENFMQLQASIEKLSQVQIQHHNQIQELKQGIGLCKTNQNSQARSSNLAKITRRMNLSPRTQILYDNNIKLKAQKRRIKRTINRMKLQNKTKKIVLNRRKYKDREDRTTKIRELNQYDDKK